MLTFRYIWDVVNIDKQGSCGDQLSYTGRNLRERFEVAMGGTVALKLRADFAMCSILERPSYNIGVNDDVSQSIPHNHIPHRDREKALKDGDNDDYIRKVDAAAL
ncbi:hypothetical protein M422DRAFT_252045 [Sphaerobolus stellatus SS14]|uniref:Uncharacterized protein n=1 Tax=Sphaerobolus stellatus (strain SS14) TaxID=990650 RepID=A0A0C9W0N7_SPHS4|nr:hypothetical protein M422DRAFT_252045 [Sphaerobolus stellatus SS14]